MKNAPICAIFTQKSKNVLERGHDPLPKVTPPAVRRGNTEMKHSNQYSFRLLQSAKIAPRMHQNGETNGGSRIWKTGTSGQWGGHL